MGYIKQFFGKEGDQIAYADIVNYFVDEKEESDKIEFKSYVAGGDEKEKETVIIRTICGMLNSVGGLVVWGAPVGQTVPGKTEKVFKGNLSPVTRLIEKDYFINRISDGITPTPNGVLYFKLEDSGSYVYLLEVEPSEYSPHQFRNIYYMRNDAQTRIAPHPYIEALFKKIKIPRLKGFVKLEKYYLDGHTYCLDVAFMIFNMSRMQNEHNVYYIATVSSGVTFSHEHHDFSNKFYGMQNHELKVIKPIPTLFYNQPYRFHETLKISHEELAKHNNKFRIRFTFGGQSSPLLLTYYELLIAPWNPIPTNLNQLIIDKDENRYSFQHSDELGKSEEELFNEILERN